MALTYVQSAALSTAGWTISLTGVGAGNFIFVSVKWENSKNNCTISDGTTSLTMGTRAESASADGVVIQCGWLLSANGGNKTYTVTAPSGSPTVPNVNVFEFSYTGTVSFDAQNKAVGTTGNCASAAIDTTGTDEVVFGVFGPWASGQEAITSPKIGTTAAARTVRGTASSPDHSTWYVLFNATQSTITANATVPANEEWACTITAFKAASAGTPLPLLVGSNTLTGTDGSAGQMSA